MVVTQLCLVLGVKALWNDYVELVFGSGHGRVKQATLLLDGTTILDDPAQSLRAREGWFNSVAF
jgi:hypothetical protein